MPFISTMKTTTSPVTPGPATLGSHGGIIKSVEINAFGLYDITVCNVYPDVLDKMRPGDPVEIRRIHG